MLVSTAGLLIGSALVTSAAAAVHPDALPSYHFGAPIQIECMNRSS
jgi:hypothetical protein